MNCTIRVAKTKALISFAEFAVSAKLICVFVFAYAKSRFSMTRLIYVDSFDLKDKILLYFNIKNIHQARILLLLKHSLNFSTISNNHNIQSTMVLANTKAAAFYRYFNIINPNH